MQDIFARGLGGSYVKRLLSHRSGVFLSPDPGISESIWFIDLSALPGAAQTNKIRQIKNF